MQKAGKAELKIVCKCDACNKVVHITDIKSEETVTGLEVTHAICECGNVLILQLDNVHTKAALQNVTRQLMLISTARLKGFSTKKYQEAFAKANTKLDTMRKVLVEQVTGSTVTINGAQVVVKITECKEV